MLQEELVKLNIDWVTNYFQYVNPTPVNADKLNKMLIKHIKNGSTIAIFPDSDIDGFFSAWIVKSLLELLGCKKIVMLQVTEKTHGLNSKFIDQTLNCNADLLITVDSSTNSRSAIEKLSAYEIDHIIIDHHVISEDIYSYPNNVVIVNSKERGNEKFSKVSAGMLCYIVAHNLLDKVKIDKIQKSSFLHKIYILGYITLYTDCMDLADEFNLSVVRNVESIKNFVPRVVARFMSEYDDLNRNFIEFKFGPRINSLIRRERFDILYDLLFKSHTDDELACLIEHTEHIYKDCKAVVEKIADEITVEVHDTYVIANLDEFSFDDDFNNVMKNFTGLIANNIASRYRRLATVLCTDRIESYKGSVRDPYSRQSLRVFSRFCDCGGHMSAFGIHLLKKDQRSFYRQLELTSSVLKENMQVAQIVLDGDEFDDRLVYQVRSIAEYNEISGNTIPKAIIRKRIGHFQKIRREEKYCKIKWEGMEIVCFTPVYMGDTIDITPTLSKTDVVCYGAITVNE